MKEIEDALLTTFQDYKLSQAEKYSFKDLLKDYSDDKEKLYFTRNRAFDIARKEIANHATNRMAALKWLEHIIKTIDTVSGEQSVIKSSAHFSPGVDCKNKLLSLIHSAKKSINVCVFTIADDGLAQALLKAHQQKVFVNIITDDDKSGDRGSDVEFLKQNGIKVKMDNSSSHMHHKFAVFDKSILASGSFNWTRSASKYNQENIIVTTDQKLVRDFIKCFDNLWKKFQ